MPGLLAGEADLHFEQISAIHSGVADLKKVFEAARLRRTDKGQGTLLFVDEIHRFNKAQQDSFLPWMEDGTITLVGATTENPSFELNAAVLSRAKVLTLNRLDSAAMAGLLTRAEDLEGRLLPVTEEAREQLFAMADGDGRYFLNLVEDLFAVVEAGSDALDAAGLAETIQRRVPVYDKGQDGHYNLISALHKSIRGSDPDAALYWLARMLVAGEDPLFICRRLVRMANEDIGLADPQAVVQALAAKDVYDFLGSPEGELALAQACVYLATAPKIDRGLHRLQEGDAAGEGNRLGHAAEDHPQCADQDDEGAGIRRQATNTIPTSLTGFPDRTIFPTRWAGKPFYDPPDKGFEREIRKRLDWWASLRGQTRRRLIQIISLIDRRSRVIRSLMDSRGKGHMEPESILPAGEGDSMAKQTPVKPARATQCRLSGISASMMSVRHS